MVSIVGVFALAWLVKALFWSGPFPPDRGWSKRQMDRMNNGKSPWTWMCWMTYSAERQREIAKACCESRMRLVSSGKIYGYVPVNLVRAWIEEHGGRFPEDL